MICPKCDSENVNIQVINECKLVRKYHGIFWWCCVGWWWVIIKWFVFTIPALIFKLFGIGKKYKIKNKIKTVAVCQNCGNIFDIV